MHFKNGQESDDNPPSGHLPMYLYNEKINALVPSHQWLTVQEMAEDIGRFVELCFTAKCGHVACLHKIISTTYYSEQKENQLNMWQGILQ